MLLGLAQVSWAIACVGVHRLFPLSPSISQCFSIHSSPAIGFHSCFFFTTDVSAPIQSTLADSEFPDFELALVPDVVVPEAEHGVRMKHKPRFKCLPWPGFKPRISQSNGRERYR